MTTITPEEYERAVELAQALDGQIPPPLWLTDAFGTNHKLELLTNALLHAHAQRQTVGTVEVCEKCVRHPSYGMLCKNDDCPIRARSNKK